MSPQISLVSNLKVCVVVLLLFCMQILSYGQSNILTISNAIDRGELEVAISEISNIENTLGNNIDNRTSFNINFFKGIISLHKGQNQCAMESFRKSCDIAEENGYIDSEYLDLLLHVMRLQFDSQDYRGVIETAQKAIVLPEELIANYPLSPYIFSTLISALSYETQFTEIDGLFKRGMQLRNLHFLSTQEQYYELPVVGIVAFIMMGQHSKAEAIYNELIHTYQSNGCSIESVETGLASLGELLDSFDKYIWLKQRQDTIEAIGDKVLMTNPLTSEGSLLWYRYFDILRATLEFFYFDVKSPKDEEYWNWCLSQMIIRFYVCCDNLPGRESIAYNNALLKKNFLNYHSGKAHKSPYSWHQVSAMLDPDEVAVEITQLPDEILILRHNAESPLSIPIDSLILEDLLKPGFNSYQEIRQLYSKTGALSRLWEQIEPHLCGVTRVYLSASNAFNRFNYAAIPHGNGVVSDKHELIRLLSTSDIKQCKEARLKEHHILNKAILYGGIKYDLCQETMLSEAKRYSDVKSEDEWSMTRGIDERIRGKFDYLNGTLDEVLSINQILTSADFSTTLFTESEANEESFKNLSGTEVDILHLATHGFLLAPLFNSDESNTYKEIIGNKYQTILSQSGLAMAGANSVWEGNAISKEIQDGVLTSKEITELDLSRVKLVVLSACDTGLGDDTNLSGLSYGVLHAFKMAGANRILASLWPIDDHITSIFMRVFYEQLIKYDCRTSLLLTQKKLQDMGFDNPYYWAGFILIE